MTQLPTHVHDFICSLETVDYFSGSGPLPEGCKLYETRAEATTASGDNALDDMWLVVHNAAWSAARHAGMPAAVLRTAESAANTVAQVASEAAAGDAVLATAGVAAWAALRDIGARLEAQAAIWQAILDAAWSARLSVLCLLAQDHIGPKHLAYALQRWAIWQAGYGVAVEVDGTYYCYRRP